MVAVESSAQPANAFPFFLGGIASWFTAWGLQQVMLQWLVVQELHASPALVGTAQMALLLPSLLLLLVGGAVADRVDVRRASIVVHVALALLCSTLAGVIGAGALSYSLIVGYALLAGSLQAFALPTRDVLLSEVIRGRVGRAVAGLMVVQHVGQGLGSLLAGFAGLVGAPVMLGAQALVLLGGVASIRRLSPVVRHAHAQAPIQLRDLQAGVLEVRRSRVLWPIVLLNVAVGLVFVSTYVVLLPLLVRELYGGGSGRLALLAGCFPIGTVAVTSLIVARGGLERPGLAVLLGMGFAGLCVGSLAFGPPFSGALLAVTGWGIGGAFAINGSRTLFQQHASVENRGRVLSVYSFAVLGAGPIGAFGTGLMAQALGTLGALGVHGTAMTLVILGSLAFSGVRHFR